MKRLVMSLAVCALLLPGFATAKDQTFTGEIMDSQGAKNASHAMMLKKEGMGDKDPNDAMTKKKCTQNCVKMGGKYVLYSAAKKTVDELDDRPRRADFAGQHVRAAGTCDKASKAI